MTRAKRGFGSVRIVLVGMIAIGALALAGCGGDSGSSSAGLTSTSSGASGSGTSDGSAAPISPAPADAGASTTPPPATTQPAAPAVSLQWAAPTENSDGTPLTDLKGYKIHYGTESQTYTGSISVDNPTVTTYLVDSLPAGTYYFAVTAYNSSGAESSLSDEVQRALN
jgi:hypothetical protein